ncbi:acyl-CoA/acyl-ACP dehydrogenase [Comamonadaceae bacterium G21597-S1]|nr:acyl-CoA/acyl-ACP dehydrogenase [Comamonadaceae bacterium G21597-S1]
MNFDFSDEVKLLRGQARRFLSKQAPPAVARRVLEEPAHFDLPLWQQIAAMGWLGATVPEAYGGYGLGYEGLCVLAEELGRVVAPVPFASSVYLVTEAILRHGSDGQKAVWLPRLVSGEAIGTFALAEGIGNPRLTAVRAHVKDGRLRGTKWPVAGGNVADFAVVVARDADGIPGLYLVDLTGSEVQRTALETIDPTRGHSRVEFADAPAERLAAGRAGWSAVEQLLERAAALLAFEQIGGATACLEMATAYAKERYAFGRPIGSFQAIKHKLADVYIATELARSNCYFGVWALSSEAPELPLAAAAARVSSIDAYHLAAKENIQVHGGMGFTWELDCHLYYRRAKSLALELGSAAYWKDRLVTHLANAGAPVSH